MKMVGVLIVFLGLVMTTVTGINLVSRKRVVDLGSIEITRKEVTPVYWSPITGGLLVAAGIALLAIGKKKV
jgi:hypothetical protein